MAFIAGLGTAMLGLSAYALSTLYAPGHPPLHPGVSPEVVLDSGVFTAVMGGPLCCVAFLGGVRYASRLEKDSRGLRFYYPNGRVESFHWQDPDLHVSFLDRVEPPGSKFFVTRRVLLLKHCTAPTAIPPGLFDQLCSEVLRYGVRVERVHREGIHASKVTLIGPESR